MHCIAATERLTAREDAMHCTSISSDSKRDEANDAADADAAAAAAACDEAEPVAVVFSVAPPGGTRAPPRRLAIVALLICSRVTPMKAESVFPTMQFHGCARGAPGAPNTSTAWAPKLPMIIIRSSVSTRHQKRWRRVRVRMPTKEPTVDQRTRRQGGQGSLLRPPRSRRE